VIRALSWFVPRLLRHPATQLYRTVEPEGPGAMATYIPIEWYPASTYAVVPVTFFAPSR
jgi:hypothetical protein